MVEKNKDAIILFDVDGTLTKARNKIEQPMIDALKKLKQKHYVAIVGGSDLPKIQEQVGKEIIDLMDFTFSENGLYSLKEGKFFKKTTLVDYLGNEKIKQFVNFCLKYLSELDIPVKRGTFIEFRSGLINISPIGRNCSQEERDEYEKFDLQNKVREKFINVLKEQFKDLNLQYSIGGQISFDVFPKGWDKSFCLQYLTEFKDVYFFGDKTFEGGNDYEIFVHERTKGYSVKSYQDTIKYLEDLFLK